MTQLCSTTSPTMWVAIDIAKVHNQVLVEFRDGRRRPFRMANNTMADFSKLGVSLVCSGCTCRIAFEATGDYHRPLAYFRQAHGFSLSLVSSIAVAYTRDALYNS
jgi:transposase